MDQADLYKFNQLIHKLDDIAGGDMRSGFAAKLRAVREELFDEEGEPMPADIVRAKDTLLY